MQTFKTSALILIFTSLAAISIAQPKQPHVAFQVSINEANQSFHVVMNISGINKDTLLVKIPAWTPGYYQLLHFADRVSNVRAYNQKKDSLVVTKLGRNGWKFAGRTKGEFIVQYDVKAVRPFVAVPFVDTTHAYVAPTGVFMHVAGLINASATVEIELPHQWIAATGLEPVDATGNKFSATDFDVLYDSPILIGPLEELPSFDVKGIPHRFIAYKPGEFDRIQFITDLKKVVEASVAVIGHIPYKHYTFLGIGSGPGGIEHLNSTTFGFSGPSLSTEDGRIRMYTFLGHEYFHHYNVKRIRPIELGPFDYDKENRTNMLWVSEGITVYYDNMVTRRAGLMSDDKLLASFRSRLLGFENKPGRLYQSATQASYNTWSDGPFGRADDEINKTVSVYDKGAILGLLLDFNIRHVTVNKRSLDDVMRKLYQEYYIKKKRGFTEAEFKATCESVAGTSLTEVFEYASTTKEIDYKKYLGYGGLEIDTEPKQVPGAWFGVSTRTRNDTLFVSQVEFESPAWKAGLRRQMAIVQVNGKASTEPLTPMLLNAKEGDPIVIRAMVKGQPTDLTISLGKKVEPDFMIKPISNPDPLQRDIFKSWTGSK